MRLSFRKIVGFGVLAIVLGFVVFQIFHVRKSVQKTLAEQRARLLEHNRVPFEKTRLTPHLSQNVRILQSAREARSLVEFQGSYFAATGGGLVQISAEGKTLRHFTVLDGLPESDLTTLAVFQNRLLIGTQTKNLVAFDGENFENYVWTDRKAQAVTSFLERDGRLLIGTFDGGLIEFDGAVFTEIKTDGQKISGVNCLFKNDSKLYVGSFAAGLWIYEADVWTHFTTADGLPSNRVVGFAVKDKKLFVATDFGLAVLEEKAFRTIAVLPSLTSLAFYDGRLFLTKANGEIFTFDRRLEQFSDEKNLQNAQLLSDGEKLWLVSNQGVLQIGGAKISRFVESQNETLTDNFVSALAFDKNQNLWVGTFRNGIDVFSPAGRKIKHLESESIREINFLALDAETVSAATSAGLIKFKKDFTSENLTGNDGLPSNSATHFAGDFIATAKGLAFRENGRIKILSTVQGLPSNSVYATAKIGQTIYAGTLGGLAQIENGRVARTFKDSNSNLKTNWVTAVCFAGERLFIGTYGGGIFELLPSGEIRSFENEIGKFAVNPNALFSDGARLYAGTLAGARVLDLSTQQWQTVKKILPAEAVFSIAGDAENIYFGTTNGIARVGKSYFGKDEDE